MKVMIPREIITRWLAAVPPLLWAHQGAHARFARATPPGADSVHSLSHTHSEK